MKAVNWLAIWCIAAALMACDFIFGRATAPEPGGGDVTVDTVVVYHTDTITQEKPVYVDRIKVRTEYVPVTDTLRIHDTTFVEVPIEQVEYRDTLYRAWVSGYHPALDSIRIFQQTKIVEVTKTITEKSKRWGIGINAGYGVTVHQGTFYTSPYIGVGVSYNFICW